MKKNYLIYFFASIVAILSSCSKDDPAPDPLLGKWELNTIKIDIQGNAALSKYNGNYTPFEYYYGTGVTRRVLDFNADKTFDFDAIFYDGRRVSNRGKWEKKDKTITLKYDDGDDQIVDVEDQDAEMLKISYTISAEEWINPSDTNQTIQADTKYTYTFEK